MMMSGLVRPMLTTKRPWPALMREKALLRWLMNSMSCRIRGIRASTAPAPNPWKTLAAIWLSRLVLKPAHRPPAHAMTPENRITGRLPTAMERGTRT
jgi:hypothetical protein